MRITALQDFVGHGGDKGRVMTPAYHDEFAQWCAALARAGADAIEVWNET